jgi:pimeloyl-ACP methyl ester carboxylesterase
MPFAQTQLLPELAKEYRVIAPDMRGHGKSDKFHDPQKYGKELAEDVVRLLDHLKVRKAHVVGYSMGAAVAGKVLAEHPDRLLSVTFGGGGPFFRQPPWFAAARAATAESLEGGKGIGPLMAALTPEGQPKPGPERVAAVSAMFLLGKDPKALAAALRGQSGLAVTEEQLKASPVPVRFVYGSLDPLKELAAASKAVLPGADVVVVEKGDHMTTGAGPEFRKAVLEFLKAHKE